MEHNVERVKVAAGLCPILGYLYGKGIIAVHGYENSVHVTQEFFKETFPMWSTEDYGDVKYLTYMYEGVKFFAIEREDN